MENNYKTMNPHPFEESPVSPGVPHSREAEEAVVGSVLINPEIFNELHFLKSADFYIHRNKWIWDSFVRLSEKRVPFDLLTVSEELERTNQLAEIGGAAYLISLINQVPTSLNAEAYGHIVEEYSIRRNMIQAANKIASLAYKDESVDFLIEETGKLVTGLQRDNGNETSLKSALSKVYDRADENARRRENGESLNVGLTTGFIDLDRILLGIEEEENVIIASRPGDGKSTILGNIATHAALNLNKRVAIFSQEMSDEEVARRLVASYSEIDSQRIKTGTMDEHEWAKFVNGIEALDQSGIYISDATSLTPSKLRSTCLKMKRSGGLDLIIVDYLQLMSAGSKMENRTREVGYISREIKRLTRELKTPIISAAQLSRAVEQRADKRPILSDLRDAGDIEQDANTVIFLWRPNRDDKNADNRNITKAIVAKRRDGATGEADLIFVPRYTKFVNATSKRFAPNEREESRIQNALSSSVGSED